MKSIKTAKIVVFWLKNTNRQILREYYRFVLFISEMAY